MPLIASTAGTAFIRTPAPAFITAFGQRIDQGLLGRTRGRRNAYRVAHSGADRLRFEAANAWTAFNVGLNDVELVVGSSGSVRYSIRYDRWARSAVFYSGILGLILIAFFLGYDVRAYLERHPSAQVPGLSIGQNLAIGWVMAIFWGFVWPWILIVLHRKPLRRLLEQLIAEVDGAAAQSARRAGT
ncbi:MAG: hypothetical protein ACRENP_16570 [Longimicrobiales bacterium]